MSGKYAALAESLGAHGIEVRSSPELHRALNEAQIWPGPPSVGRAAVVVAAEERRRRR